MIPAPRRWRRFFHVRPGTPYHVENSIRGLDRAVREGYSAIDLDAQVTRDGIMVNTHWGRPCIRDGFRPPEGVSRWARVSDLDWSDVSKFRTADGYRIHRMAHMIHEAHARGLRVELDVKNCPGFDQPAAWAQVAPVVARTRGQLVVKCATTIPGWPRNLEAAHAAGLTTMVMTRNPIPTRYARFVDYLRRSPRQ